MALQSSGKISASDINTELTRASNASFSMGNAEERALAGIPSGPISMSDFYGKSSYTPPPDWSNLSQQKIQASDKQRYDVFGQSVAMSGDGTTAIADAHGEDTGGTSAGAAYIYTRSGNTWTQRQKILAGDKQAEDHFGYSASISSDGQTAIVGAWGEDTGGSNAGAAYIYTRSGNTWTQRQKIQAGDRQADDWFGVSVSMSGDGTTAIVGAIYKAVHAGAAYIFTRSGDTWTQRQKILASDSQWSDYFGVSVSMSGDGATAIVGAYGGDTSISMAGAAYIFTRSGDTWVEEKKLIASDRQVEDYFGWSVAISGDGQTVIVGAYSEDTSGSSAGAAYIFTRSGETWTQRQKIQASDKQAGDQFGYSVSMSGDGMSAVVGSPYEDTGGSDAGAAYIFTRSGNTWTQRRKIQSGDRQGDDNFGYSVAISGDGTTAIVGAFSEDTGGSAAGAAYIFMDQ